MKLFRTFLMLAIALPAVFLPLSADEGLWPYNQFPKDAVKEKYMVDVTTDFLDNLRLASARIPGGSASFVSANGLLLTNQHLVAACLGKLSTAGHDLRKDGFYAATQSAEQKCDGIDASVLTTIEDVTAKVKAAAKDNAPAAQALELRNGVIAKLEKECADKSGGRCTVVKLFAGGRYDLYTYKVYNDLRLVFAPETELALFGHERDAVTYLRYGLDVAFLRAYEAGKPAATPHFLKWSADGVRPGDVVFSSGNPQVTARAITAAELKYLRDSVLPLTVSRLQPLISQLATFSAQSEANKQAAEPTLAALLNQYKFAAGKLIGLRDDRMVNRKTVFENKIKRAVENDPKLGVGATKVWDDIQMAYRMWSPSEKPYELLENAPALGSTLFQIARQLVRNGSLDPALEAAPPVNDKVEVILLTRYLEDLKTVADKSNDKDIPIKAVLNGKTPQQVAEAAVMGTTLKDPAARKKLSGNAAGVKASEDPMIKMALAIDGPAKSLRKKHDDMIGSLETSAEEKIAGYRFKLFGASDYPDATGTPRVEFGVVKGYTDRAGTPTPAADSFGGLYYRTNNEGPYEIPQHWVDLKSTLNLELPLDFVSTCDVGGGDYGSGVVNRAGELVGVTFDGNLESMPDTYLYSDEQARAVHVAVQGIAQALDKAYKATALLTELGIPH